MAEQKYDESSIQVLEGLDPIKLRPGMYTSTENPTHSVTEIIDNALDEALQGSAKNVEVILYSDGSLSVEDDGRGIPTGMHPTYKKPTIQIIFEVIHSGGKFAKTDSDSGYKISGGLHGVGVCVTNALSSRLEIRVKRQSQITTIAFGDGKLIEPATVVGECPPDQSGTFVRAWPNPTYFDSPNISRTSIESLLRFKAMLMPGVNVSLKIQTADGFEEIKWHFERGMTEYLELLVKDKPLVGAMYTGAKHYLEGDSEHFSDGEGVEWSIQWADSPAQGESYVNLVPTYDGGTHESGLRDVVFQGIRTFAETHGLLQKNVKLSAEDVWCKLNFILSIKMLDPAFASQTKRKLSSREALKLVFSSIKDSFDLWLNNNIESATEITTLAVENAIARTKTLKPVERKKTSSIALLPGKLTDAEFLGANAELYLVEGDSAGGSAKSARDKSNQGILSLKGKGLNSWEMESSQILGNTEVLSIATSIGIDPHLKEDTLDLSQLRYEKICLLSDADVDGEHICALILTLFIKHFPKLLLEGHIYIAHPPLYIVDVESQGKGKPARKLFALDNKELNSIKQKLKTQGVKEEKIAVGYLKGLGEMDPINLYESTLNPSTRKLSRLKISNLDETLEVFNIMMSDKNADLRKEHIANFTPEHAE